MNAFCYLMNELGKSATKKPTSAFPSGISHNWQPKTPPPKSLAKNSAGKKAQLLSSSPTLEHDGGLADEDVSAEVPPDDLPGRVRNLERTNDVRITNNVQFFFSVLIYNNISLSTSQVTRKKPMFLASHTVDYRG
jgi:hypothetical protein